MTEHILGWLWFAGLDRLQNPFAINKAKVPCRFNDLPRFMIASPAAVALVWAVTEQSKCVKLVVALNVALGKVLSRESRHEDIDIHGDDRNRPNSISNASHLDSDGVVRTGSGFSKQPFYLYPGSWGGECEWRTS